MTLFEKYLSFIFPDSSYTNARGHFFDLLAKYDSIYIMLFEYQISDFIFQISPPNKPKCPDIVSTEVQTGKLCFIQNKTHLHFSDSIFLPVKDPLPPVYKHSKSTQSTLNIPDICNSLNNLLSLRYLDDPHSKKENEDESHKVKN